MKTFSLNVSTSTFIKTFLASRVTLVTTRMCALVLIALCVYPSKVWATDVPQGFEVVEVFSSLESPAGFAFSPDGRMFICERINGKLLVAEFNASSGQWELTPTPFYTFETPNEGGNPVRVRSAGLRDIAFDPDFATNGYIYAFYMENTTRQNRVVRIQTSASNPNRAEGGSEVLLLEVPYNGDASSGSHNGGAIEFGPDGRLYITTGDGWNGGDVVQSLTTFTGKVFRINKDGSIPTDNPFYNQTTGKYRAIYGLGLRNPYSMSSHPETGQLYINEAGGGNKASIYLVEPGANYGHQGYTGIGSQRSEWANGSGDAGGNLITGGAWYPSNGYWPSTYHGVYFTALWGNNGQSTGRINYVQSQTQTTVTPFGTQVGQSGLKPVLTRIGPDENLYYMLTDYESGSGRVQMVRWSGQASAATPSISPNGGAFNDPVSVTLSSTTGGAEIRYTLDGTTPNESSPLYTGPVTVSSSSVLNARAYGNDLAPSSVSSATFTIGQVSNIPPVAEAGSDQYATPNTLVTISGAGSYDPDGDDLTLSWHWEQVSGPTVELFSSEDAVAFFTPTQEGTYQFELTVIDAQSESSDVMSVIVANELPLDAGLVGYWALDETGGSTARDETGSHDGTLSNGPAWSPDEGQVGGALLFDGSDDYVDIGGIDIGGSSGMTLAFWFKADDFGVHDARFVSKATGDQEQDHYWMVSTINETALRFRLKTGGTTTTLISSGNVIRAGTWYHVAAVYDGSQMQIVLDGAVIASTQKSGTVGTNVNVHAALGNQPAGSGNRAFDGLLDDVRVYNRALTLRSIQALSDAGGQEIPIAPSIYPAGGTYTGPVEVTLSLPTSQDQLALVEDIEIRYTLDGSVPSSTSPLYDAAIPIDVTTTLNARSFNGSVNASTTSSATFTIEEETDLLAYWMLDETTGTTAADETGTHDGQVMNGASWKPDQGVRGGALLFDGIDDYVDLGGVDITSTEGATIAFWFNADDFDVHDARFISKATGVQEQDHYWMVSTMNGSSLRFRLKTGGVVSTLVSSQNVIRPGQWYHVAATYDGSAMRIFLDGTEVASRAKTGPIDTNGGIDAAVGNQPEGRGNRPFDGHLDEIRMYGRALDALEIAALIGNSGQQILPSPTFSPNGGSFQESVQVTLSSSVEGADIRYTVDGSEPTETSPLYGGVFSVTATSTVQARAFMEGMTPSGVASAEFTIGASEDQQLLAYWPLDELAGTTADDVIGTNSGTLLNGPIWEPNGGKFAGALRFDGLDDRVDVGSFDIPEGEALTIAFWFNADNFDVHDARFISKASGVQERDHYWMVSTIHKTALRFRLNAGGRTKTLQSPKNVITSNTWYHVAATYDGSRMRLYLNGEELVSTGKTGEIAPSPSVGVALGNQPAGAGDRAFDGMLDDVRIYAKALTSSDLMTLADTAPVSGALLGDASGNGTVSALDAALVLQYMAGLVRFDNNAVHASEVSGNALVSSLDASYILRYTAGTIDCLPAEEGCGGNSGAAKQEDVSTDVRLGWGALEQGTSLHERILPLTILEGHDTFRAFDMTLTFDPDHVMITGVDPHVSGDWQVAYRIDEQAGVLNMSMAGGSPAAVEELAALSLLIRDEVDNAVSATVRVNDGPLQTIEAIQAEATPDGFSLAPNYPNPFNPSTVIRYQLPESSQVQLDVFDVTGRRVVTLVNEVKHAGDYEAVFDAASLPSGMYFYRLKAGVFIQTRSMLLLR